ncbi:MAG: SCO family protein [Proteobacteria bacterium]|nr:SCO family protein [Pseudomonadota bacterium]
MVKILSCVCFAIFLAIVPAVGQDAHPPPHTAHVMIPEPEAARPRASNIVHLELPDLELVNQDGEKGRFLSDIIGDRLAAVTFTYTTCTTACPILDGIFKNVQAEVADDLGKDTVLITLSIDPTNDIPERLKAHAEKLGAKPGWTFLTGEKQTVNEVLKGLEVFSTDIYNHPPTVFVVDGKREVWSRLNGFPSPDTIVEVLSEYRTARLKR